MRGQQEIMLTEYVCNKCHKRLSTSDGALQHLLKTACGAELKDSLVSANFTRQHFVLDNKRELVEVKYNQTSRQWEPVKSDKESTGS